MHDISIYCLRPWHHAVVEAVGAAGPGRASGDMRRGGAMSLCGDLLFDFDVFCYLLHVLVMLARQIGVPLKMLLDPVQGFIRHGSR
jgi:hypothetical protein